MKGDFTPWRPDRTGGPGWIEDENGCHIWTGSKSSNGFGHVKVAGRQSLVHRVRYEKEVGPIPTGLHLDHYVCDNGPGGCCNPLHMRPVSPRENVLRGNSFVSRQLAQTHCKRGHELRGDNLTPAALRRGMRACRECQRQRQRRVPR